MLRRVGRAPEAHGLLNLCSVFHRVFRADPAALETGAIEKSPMNVYHLVVNKEHQEVHVAPASVLFMMRGVTVLPL